MQNQNRAGGDANAAANAVAGDSAGGASTGASGGDRRAGGGTSNNARPPSISARPGFSDALIPVGDGNGNPSTPDGGAAFNLLGLPPSPAPRSGVMGASAWGATVGGGGGGSLRGGGDVMAGQVRCRHRAGGWWVGYGSLSLGGWMRMTREEKRQVFLWTRFSLVLSQPAACIPCYTCVYRGASYICRCLGAYLVV